jgi:FtsZ-interacting cell division protein YlmF
MWLGQFSKVAQKIFTDAPSTNEIKKTSIKEQNKRK